jgi:serine/threonine protein kinase
VRLLNWSTQGASETAHPLIGTTLRASYRVLRVLAHGQMGLVFEAELLRLRRLMAVKLVARHLSRDPRALARFYREAEIISLLNHPHIVQIVDFDATDDGDPYIVMELLKGENLEQRLERESPLPFATAVRIACQAGSALSAVHSSAVVHRDLKPGNVFLCDVPDEAVFVKLLDFGIGKRLAPGPGITGENAVLGTPEYMPPEQALGRTAFVDERGDQYSLAVMTYEMLAGRVPFTGDTVGEILPQVIESAPPPLNRFVQGVPPLVEQAILRALAKEPKHRFASVAEFVSALATGAGTTVPPLDEAPTTLRLATPVPSNAPSARPSAAPSAVAHAPSVAPFASSLPPRATSVPPRESFAPSRSTRPASGLHPWSRGTVPPEMRLPLAEINGAIERARQAAGAKDFEVASAEIDAALAYADLLNDDDAFAIVREASALIDGVLESRLGGLSAKPRVASEGLDVHVMRLSPEQAFLLSRIDGRCSVEEVLDLTPLPRRRTLLLLVRMLRQKIIAFG